MVSELKHWRTLGRLLLVVAALVATVVPVMAGKSKFNKQLSIGDAAPDWTDLPGVDDKRHSLAEFKEASVVVIVFTGNRCPVSKIYDERVMEFARKYSDRKVQAVAINVDRGDEAVLKKMEDRPAKRMYPFPYVLDGTLKVARSYGATVTPHFFVLDSERRIAYMGAFDDHLMFNKVEKTYLADAVDALLAGKTPRVPETLQRGCEILYDSTATPDDE